MSLLGWCTSGQHKGADTDVTCPGVTSATGIVCDCKCHVDSTGKGV